MSSIRLLNSFVIHFDFLFLRAIFPSNEHAIFNVTKGLFLFNLEKKPL